ncbi:peroxisomal membrane protein 11C-like [Babylonia areolata]|uniref:peroxisomal membrane protein 11C-like n=1 Tax=Babylonia areolata TaxID=304850 RepID=UPI003FCF2368
MTFGKHVAALKPKPTVSRLSTFRPLTDCRGSSKFVIMDVVKLLESYRGKDRIIRLSTYVLMFLGGRGSTPLQVKCRKVSAELGGCRVILRLFDDFSMLMLNLSKGFGLKETSSWLRPLEVASGILGQLYYPVEHLAWLRDKEVLPGKSALLWLLGLVIWALSLLTEIIKCVVKLRVNWIQTHRLQKQKHLEKSEDMEERSQQAMHIDSTLHKLCAQRHDLVLAIVQSAADLVNAVSWLPRGTLWAQRLSPAVNGVCGTLATAVMIYRNWPPK